MWARSASGRQSRHLAKLQVTKLKTFGSRCVFVRTTVHWEKLQPTSLAHDNNGMEKNWLQNESWGGRPSLTPFSLIVPCPSWRLRVRRFVCAAASFNLQRSNELTENLEWTTAPITEELGTLAKAYAESIVRQQQHGIARHYRIGSTHGVLLWKLYFPTRLVWAFGRCLRLNIRWEIRIF